MIQQNYKEVKPQPAVAGRAWHGDVQAELAALRKENAELRSIIERYKRSEVELRRVMLSTLTPGQKVSWFHLHYHWMRDDLPRDNQGRAYTNLTTLAIDCGTSDETLGKHLEHFQRLGLVSKAKVFEEREDHSLKPVIYVAPIPEKVQTVRLLTKEESGNKWGGKRYPCPTPNCDGEMVVERTVKHLRCPKCNHCSVEEIAGPKQIESTAPAPEREPQDVGVENVPLPQPTLSVVENEKQESLPLPQDADMEEDPDPLGETLAELAPLPTLWPIPAYFEEDLEGQTSAYLEQVAWECSAIVQMGQTKAYKYFEPTCDGNPKSEKESWNLSVWRQHLRAEELPHLGWKGKKQKRIVAFKATTQERSSMVIVEFDRPAGVQAVLDACPLLLAHGWLPLLSFSPVHGAGLVDEKGPRDSVHLILQWSEPVQVKAVLAKLYTLCPDLKQYQDKIWPNGGSNMRAPLSYYTQPDASGWCTLVSPLTGEKQQHGPEAWRLLLSHRADPATAPGLPAEPPAPKPEPTLRSAQAATTAASTGTGPQFRACDAIKWFNSLHTLDDIHPRATKTHALAVWRQETVPSVKYNDSGPYAGKAFDYGTKEWMDPFSLWWHVKGYAKDDAVRQVMRDYRVYLLSQSRRN